jgi:DNA adenine methylase
MKRYYSPLRYPGGKGAIAHIMERIIIGNNLINCIYVEPFAGGCGIGIKLLLEKICGKLIINDADYRIYAFWQSILTQTNDFCALIEDTEINIDEWNKQKSILLKYENYSQLEVGFATFFLNRCNRSGILKAGPIGGKEQNGNYKMDCRFNKKELVKRIKEIAQYSESIEVYQLDASLLMNTLREREEEMLIYFDPPYVEAGKELYLNYYQEADHKILSDCIKNNLNRKRWIITYDNKEIISSYYNDYQQLNINIQYSLESKKVGTELFIANNLIIDFEDKQKNPVA